jgi:uncharacterized membrane protein
MNLKALLVGESWNSTSTHIKGFDFFSSSYYATGGDHLIAALAQHEIAVRHLPSHEAAKEFPYSVDELRQYDAVILSDIGANTLLLPPETFLEGKRRPNRLETIKQYVLSGGGLVMAGGYLSFQGIYGAARYRNTAIEEVLPVSILPFDDRIETPEGIVPTIADNNHFMTRDLPDDWPFLLGFNEVELKEDATLLLRVGRHPLLASGVFGEGRSVAWTSDIGPHWCPKEFVEWNGFGQIWARIIRWVSQPNNRHQK